MDILLFASVVSLLACFVIVAGELVHVDQSRRGSHKPYPADADLSPGGRHFRATAIESKGITCLAVRDLLDIRLLDEHNSLPGLPVDGCNMEHCNCHYVRFVDRRDRARDRRLPVSLQSQMFRRSGKTNQRTSECGRRASDLDLLVFQV
jgi:hypothetical protein